VELPESPELPKLKNAPLAPGELRESSSVLQVNGTVCEMNGNDYTEGFSTF
jgi:hypothetical protein